MLNKIKKKVTKGMVKWCVILIVAGAIYYCLFPKYTFLAKGIVRCNRITGSVERWVGYEGEWTPW